MPQRRRKVLLTLVLIVVLGFLLRIYKISSVPPALSNDEIATAYDAYSLAKTGRDSHGRYFPISFQSNNDYKPAAIHYLTAVTISIFGNSEMSVRLPSVILGTFTILILYLLVVKLTGNKTAALVSAFLLAITPGLIYSTRTAHSYDIALFFLLAGIYSFFYSLGTKRALYLSAILLSVSIYSYHTEKVLTPVLMLVLSFLYRKEIGWKKISTWWAIFLVACLPLVYDALYNSGATRAGTEVLLNDFLLRNQLAGVANPISRLFIFFSFWLDKYLGYQGLGYIFVHGLDVSGDYGISDFGFLNLLQLPFFLLGIIYVAKNIKKKGVLFFFLWFLVGPLVPSLTQGELNLGRNLPTLIPLTVICAWGILFAREFTKIVSTTLVLGAIVLNFAFFYRYYTTQFPFHFAERWTYGFKEIAQYADVHKGEYDSFVIDSRFGVVNNTFIGLPHLYILYFNKLDPQEYLDTKVENPERLVFLGKYDVHKVDWTKEEVDQDVLYIVSSHSTPPAELGMEKVHQINLPDGTEAFRFYRVQK